MARIISAHLAGAARSSSRTRFVIPSLWGAALAAFLGALWLLTHRLPFAADDFVHLAASYRDQLFTDHFIHWMSRAPVWAAAQWWFFRDHAFENSPWPSAFFFAAHCLGTGLIVAGVCKMLLRRAPPIAVATAAALFCFYPNAYEINLWTTCMPYSLGAVFWGLSLHLERRGLQAGCLLLAFLTYETFLLPAIFLCGLRCYLEDEGPRQGWRGCTPCAAALVAFAACRGAASYFLGAFQHRVDFSPHHAAANMVASLGMLGRFRHFHMHTGKVATASFAVLLAISVLLWWRRRGARMALGLILGCWATTGLFWLLEYGAVRAVYGSQLLLCGLLSAGLVELWASRPRWAPCLSVILAASFMAQQWEILQVKQANAAIMLSQEQAVESMVQACMEPCVIPVADMEDQLQPDWVALRYFEGDYLAWLHGKYAGTKQVSMRLNAGL